MKKVCFSFLFAIAALFAVAQPPQGNGQYGPGHEHHQGGRPPHDTVSPMQNLFGPLVKRFQVHGYVQAGYEWNNQNDVNMNEFNLKRTGLVVFAQITDRWSFFFFHDFNSEVQDFYTDFRITNSKALNVRFGQFKNSLSLENPYSPAVLELVDVTSQATTYFAGTVDPLFADKVMYGRDLGLEFFGELFTNHFKYELAVMNGQGINIKDRNNKKDFLAKLEYDPMPNLRFVTSGQIGRGSAPNYCWLNGSTDYISPYNQAIKAGEDYERDRWTFGAEYKTFVTTPTSDWKKRPFSIRAEYMGGKDGDVNSYGAYATTAIPLSKTLDAIASYDFINYNSDEDLKSTKLIIGLQYWFFRSCRVQLQYSHCMLDNMVSGVEVVPQPMGPPQIIKTFQPDYDKIQLQVQVGF